ncbi:ABC transporter ATP-binding protein [Vagococcus salmoninarum]|uniref:ABC transporter domain-containing protein n=1 Tax=Vagococcus salmoninarum TaxID=2739 RepID=A0A429ZJU3_9ENTE|nr:ABC transporter ATP-binding protein [Vagococcus salmoninarum]RST93964.1 hypothetical protein CBF35_10945 [Vagococcus salmoninarum]
MIKLEMIKKIYKQKELTSTGLDIKKLEIKQGDFIGITGSSGSGKSTLLNILGTLDAPTQGSYLYKENDVATYSNKQLANFRNQEIGFVVQFFALIQDYTIFENIQLPLHYQKLTGKAKKALIHDVADKLDIRDILGKYPNQLSGGQQQRAAIARAMINQPPLILADEPTGNLDNQNTIRVMTYLKDLHNSGHTICLVTHEAELLTYCNRKIVLEDGRISYDEFSDY